MLACPVYKTKQQYFNSTPLDCCRLRPDGLKQPCTLLDKITQHYNFLCDFRNFIPSLFWHADFRLTWLG